MPPIIALLGAKGAGKSTLADLLVSSRDFVKLPFAGPLKQMLRALLACQSVPPATIHEMLEGQFKETPSVYLGGRSPRHAMQTLGTEWRDTMHRELWSRIWKGKLSYLPTTTPGVVVDDVRFPHEEKVVRAMGGKIILIKRPGQRSGPDLHISEHAWESILPDAIITNEEREAFKMLDDLAAAGFPFVATRRPRTTEELLKGK